MENVQNLIKDVYYSAFIKSEYVSIAFVNMVCALIIFFRYFATALQAHDRRKKRFQIKLHDV